MKLLAKAYPNPRYINYRNLKDVVIEARLVNGQIRFYETHTNDTKWTKCITEQTVRQLFRKDISIDSRPFLCPSSKDPQLNAEFYAILMRYRKQYRDTFKQLKQTSEDVKVFPRTKFNKT